MYGTNFQRTVRLLKYLLLHPNDIQRWISTSIKKGISPIELGLPWISYSAIDFLDKYIKPEHHIVELGGGGSTIFFAKRSRNILCIESKENWVVKIKENLKKLNLEHVEIKLRPYNPNDLESFIKSDFLTSIEGNKYDLIFIDCLDHSAAIRPLCFNYAEKSIKEGGCIVIDDSFRYKNIRKENNAKYWKEFYSIGPCRTGVTTTDIFFY